MPAVLGALPPPTQTLDEQRIACAFVQAAEKAMAAMLKLPDAGRIITKKQSRSAFAAEWREQLEAESEMGYTQLQDTQTMAAMASVLERLSGKARSRL